MNTVIYPCPCCGHLVFNSPPGSCDICPICFWEDDVVQLRWPDWTGGANGPSLKQSQKNYLQFSAIEERFIGNVRRPSLDEAIDDGWRVISEQDCFENMNTQEQSPWPDDLTVLYWWRRGLG